MYKLVRRMFFQILYFRNLKNTPMPSLFNTKSKNLFTVAFYNLENLFDTINDPNTLDDEYTPEGEKRWTYSRYAKKIHKLSSVISQIGIEKSLQPPVLVGVAEVENKKVLHDLVSSKELQNHYYDFVHYNSPDMRGIDVALLYNKQFFELLDSTTSTLYIEEDGVRSFTRDVLMVKGKLNGELVYILVNHWPSRRKGTEESEYKRVEAADLNIEIMELIEQKDKDAKFIIMGDFNENPTDLGITTLLEEDLFNPMKKLIALKKGSLKYRDDWFLFDQILFSNHFLNPKKGEYSFVKAGIFNRDFLKVYKGKNKGKPFRTHIGPWYQGGFSDHFPVFAYLKKKR